MRLCIVRRVASNSPMPRVITSACLAASSSRSRWRIATSCRIRSWRRRTLRLVVDPAGGVFHTAAPASPAITNARRMFAWISQVSDRSTNFSRRPLRHRHLSLNSSAIVGDQLFARKRRARARCSARLFAAARIKPRRARARVPHAAQGDRIGNAQARETAHARRREHDRGAIRSFDHGQRSRNPRVGAFGARHRIAARSAVAAELADGRLIRVLDQYPLQEASVDLALFLFAPAYPRRAAAFSSTSSRGVLSP